ncbi:unnamed protein product [Calicophoron daubneyi]|uniref:J domain-containing protein n=1 Tax=Calicophoron daubneyi TaxID=300641 RepID=A0AAV2TXW3_CALDB
MARDHFEFDENGDTFFCFLVAFYTIILIPVTYFFWPSFEIRESCEQGKRKCMCQPCQVKRHHMKSSTPMKKLKKFLVKGGFALAWGVFFIMMYKLTFLEANEPGFDPFALLEIDRGATVAEIRKAYKRLSLKYHPDKGGDAKRFILISKAYSALTNEESRRNWEEHGNPDGPGAAHFGIALPKWMIQRENFYVVIGAYVLLFMFVLPITVGTWWYNTMKFSNNHVLLDTIRCFCGTFMRSPYMAMPRVIKVLSNAYEFNPAYNKEIVCRPSDNVELPPLIMQIPIFTIFKKAIVGSPSSVKARALIYAHLERIELSAKTLHLDRQYIIKNSPRLIDEMMNSLLYVLAIAMDEAGSRHKTPQHLATIENCMHLVPMLVQALSDNASPLLQLPHIGQTQLRHMAARQRNIKSVRQLIRLPDDKRRALLRSLSDEQYRDLLNVCASMPLLEISYRCEVLDDEDPSIWPFSMVTATITLTRHPLFEPSAATSAPVCGISNTLPELPYPGDGKGLRTDWSAYNHSPNSQLYAPADANLDTSPMSYTDYRDESDDRYALNSNKPKKSTTPVWDKGKRKKPVRKGNKRKQEQNKQRVQRQNPEEKPLPQTTTLDDRESDAEDSEISFFKADEADGPENITNNGVKLSDEGSTNRVSSDTHPETLAESNGDGANVADGDIHRTPKKSTKPVHSSASKTPQANRIKPTDSKAHCTHLVHCPYFPVEKFEGWWVYIVDRKTRQLITKPVYLATLQTQEEIQLRFVAPSVPGSYMYTLCVRSDSYVDCDFSETIRFTVCPLPERIVQYLREQEEVHTYSSSSSCGEESEGNLSGLDEPEDVGPETEEFPVNQATDEDQQVPNDEQDEVDEEDSDDHGIDQDRLSAYLAKA